MWGDGRKIHGVLGDLIYRVLAEAPACELAVLRHRFATSVRETLPFRHRLPRHAATILPHWRWTASHSSLKVGCKGRSPVPLVPDRQQGEMIFYTTTPWLYPTYAPIVFQKNYNYLQEMETIVAHEHLFQLKTVQDGKVLVEETTNEAARSLALYEIRTFKKIVQQTYSSALGEFTERGDDAALRGDRKFKWPFGATPGLWRPGSCAGRHRVQAVAHTCDIPGSGWRRRRRLFNAWRDTPAGPQPRLIAVGVPQRRGNERVFGLLQGGEGLGVPRTLGGQRRSGPLFPYEEASP